MKYVIRVKGHLDPFWQEWFDSLSITHQSDGTTLLTGPVQDQAALYGILCKMRDLRLTPLDLSVSAPTPFQKSERCLSGCALSPLLSGQYGTILNSDRKLKWGRNEHYIPSSQQ